MDGQGDERRGAGGRAGAPARAWTLAGVSAGLGVGAVVVAMLHGVSLWRLVQDHDLIGPASAVFMAAVGALVLRQDRANRIVWLLFVPALSAGVYSLARQYAFLAAPPGWELATWLALWTNLPAIMIGTGLLFVLFPDGHPPSRRWRPVVWVGVGSTVAVTLLQAVVSWPLRVDPRVLTAGEELRDTIFSIGFLIGLLLYIVSLASLVVRYRHATARLRQQIKWVVWSQLLALPMQAVAMAGAVGALLELLSVPVTFGAIAVAIFRYRLYDIDRLVSRTLVYALLSAFVVGGYALGVLVLGQAVGQGGQVNSLVVAGTTLALAALFQPLRRRFQDAVDRRFNRRRYDAARTIDAFATRLRHHTDLDTLRTEMLAVVDSTMQPTKATLWLAPGRQREGAAVMAARASSV
jgi:hypothetical protein